MILEEIVETYRRVYVKLMTEKRAEDARKENKTATPEEEQAAVKQMYRDAKANIKDWANQATKCEAGFFAIHFACF